MMGMDKSKLLFRSVNLFLAVLLSVLIIFCSPSVNALENAMTCFAYNDSVVCKMPTSENVL